MTTTRSRIASVTDRRFRCRRTAALGAALALAARFAPIAAAPSAIANHRVACH